MKPQAKLALSFATFVALGAGGVVHMTDLPRPGAVGVSAPKDLEFRTRRIAEGLRESVVYQCEEIGRRSTRFAPQLQRFVEGLQATLAANGFETELFEYKAGTQTFQSVIGRRKGAGTGTLLVGTHYDSYSKSLCANATASAVATVSEISRALRDEVTDKDVIIAFFGSGEKPHRGRDTMGAAVWLEHAKSRGQLIDQAIIVSSFGAFRPGDGGQNSSFPWYVTHPRTTDWVGIYGGVTHKDEVAAALEVWDRVTDLPARGFAAPTWMLGIPSTDQVPFMEAGIPTILFSDTGGERDTSIRGAHDGPYQITYEEMALRVEALIEVVKVYANR